MEYNYLKVNKDFKVLADISVEVFWKRNMNKNSWEIFRTKWIYRGYEA